MKYLKKNHWQFSLGQRIGLFSLLFLILLLEFLIHFDYTAEKLTYAAVDRSYYEKLEQQLADVVAQNKSNSNFKSYTTTSFNKSKFHQDSIKPFNPNDLPQQGWERLGFTSKQAEVIMKYKQMLGGNFESKEQLKKCFVISDEVYATIAPKILLPEKSKSDYKLAKEQTKRSYSYVLFNPNDYTEKDWMKIGFSSKQAEVILKYKRIVGGEFTSKEQLRKCFVISDEKFAEMQNFINLPESAPVIANKESQNSTNKTQDKTENKSKVEVKEKFNPNHLDKEGWINLGFSDKQAQTILNYKRSLGGSFRDAFTLSKSYVISEEKFKELEPYLIFD